MSTSKKEEIQRFEIEDNEPIVNNSMTSAKTIILIIGIFIILIIAGVIVGLCVGKKKKEPTPTEEELYRSNISSKIRSALTNDPITPNTMFLLAYGSFLTDKQKMLDRINEIRKEACDEGVRNPKTGNPLTSSDYYPLKWSTDLERMARLRAAESIFTNGHTRMNGVPISDFTYNDVKSNTEILTWNNVGDTITLINQWYEEKYDWIQQTGKETGHYEALITQINKYVGLGLYYNEQASFKYCMAGLFTDSTVSETQFLDKDEGIYQQVDVLKSSVQSNFLDGTTELGQSLNQQLLPKVNTDYKTLYPNNFHNYKFTSTDSSIISVNDIGKVIGVKIGSATIKCFDDSGKDFASLDINVICAHNYAYTYTKDANNTVKGHRKCARCGQENTFTPPSKYEIWWRNSKDTSGIMSFYPPKANPVGTSIIINVQNINGDNDYRNLGIKVSEAGYITYPNEFVSDCSMTVVKSGNISITIYAKYNPYLNNTYTLTLTS